MVEVLFLIVICILIRMEYKVYNTFLNPFILISSVYSLLILVNNTIAVRLGFYEIDNSSIMYIMCFLIIIFLVSMFFNKVIYKKNVVVKDEIKQYGDNIVNKDFEILIVFLIGLIAKCISLIQCIQVYGINNIKGKEFGIFAHIGSLAIVLVPYILFLFLKNKNKFYYIIIIMVLYINLFLFGGKYTIFITTMYILIFNGIMNDISIKKSLKYFGIFGLGGILSFVGIYALKPIILLGKYDKGEFLESVGFSVKHFAMYLLSPLISTNYYFNNRIDMGEGIMIMFTVPINIIKALFRTGKYINPVITENVPISNYQDTNVGGIFAESVYESGFLVATIYIIVIFCIIYYFYNSSKYKAKNVALTAYMLSVVTMLFFGNFFTVSGIFLNFILLYVVEVILRNKRFKYMKNPLKR
ncbi:Uncharacterised protein [Clostridium putrefaciens]|uniref:Oligosaccharide repeat unit polymerase n=1 Tax=Clostridium putrefaciens TaxID=99675 RepID=A0A381J594_9CLOT|nr:O-antigen polymerase [Clostridium putrefaciens]SUY45818.1 Uncharacterised protein [Clostridium putrefaciens]